MSCVVSKISNVKDLTIHMKGKGLIRLVLSDFYNHGMFKVPFGYAITRCEKNVVTSKAIPLYSGKMYTVPCWVKLTNTQTKTVKRMCELLKECRHLLLNAYTGFGKTFVTCVMMYHVPYKTLIVVNKIAIANQWVAHLRKICPHLRVSVYKNDVYHLRDTDVVVANVITLDKLARIGEFGLLILDEVHSLLSTKNHKKVLCISPKYMIGLSATPYRYDELNECIEMFFTQALEVPKKQILQLHEYRTGIHFHTSPRDWNEFTNEMCEHWGRNKLIAEVTKKQVREGRLCLVLTKRIKHSHDIHNLLTTGYESIDPSSVFYYDELTAKDTKRMTVLIGTINKLGMGFDGRPPPNTLIMACSIKQYMDQKLGRILRKSDVSSFVPRVVEFVDSNTVLQRHFSIRQQAYRRHKLTRVEVNASTKKYMKHSHEPIPQKKTTINKK